MKHIIYFLTIFISVKTYALELDLENYLKMQQALAADNFKASLIEHDTICKKQLIKKIESYKDCQKSFQNISELRESFKALSELFIKHGNKEEIKKTITAFCPMANAKWLQKEEEIKNPYYGKSMLGCGEKLK